MKSKHGLRDSLSRGSLIGLLVGVGFFLAAAYAASTNILGMQENEARIRNTHEVLTTLDSLLIAALDTETGQRGFVLTGDDKYLEPYHQGVAAAQTSLSELETLTQYSTVQRRSLRSLRAAGRYQISFCGKGHPDPA